jgi:hypothetical protein
MTGPAKRTKVGRPSPPKHKETRKNQSKQPDYWNGHDTKTDATLVHELFHGRMIRNQGRARTVFPSNEREAIEALQRLLLHGLQRAGWMVEVKNDEVLQTLVELVQALDPNGDTPRKLEIGFRAPGNRSDLAADLQIMLCVNELLMENKKKKSAVSLAGETFHLSRKGVFKALRRAEEHLKKRWTLEKRP